MDGTGAVGRGYLVQGRVQGVGFRWWTRGMCRSLGIGGHVRNLPDGTVEVQVIGPAEAVAELERLLWKGPPAARVDEVRVIGFDDRWRPDRLDVEL